MCHSMPCGCLGFGRVAQVRRSCDAGFSSSFLHTRTRLCLPHCTRPSLKLVSEATLRVFFGEPRPFLATTCSANVAERAGSDTSLELELALEGKVAESSSVLLYNGLATSGRAEFDDMATGEQVVPDEHAIENEKFSNNDNDAVPARSIDCYPDNNDTGLDNRPAFQHAPLKRADKQIRLLRFIPSMFGVISCTMETFWIAQAPEYIAISYVWGDPRNPRKILLNGKQVSVTRNCHFALWQVSRQCLDELKFFWLDSTCINQTDLAEKADQVKMMGGTFERAQVVYACVGKHEHGSQKLLWTLQKLHDFVSSGGCDATETDLETWLGDIIRLSDPNLPISKNYTARRYVKRLIPRLSHFETRKYWRRMWIVQETWLARALHILCGDTAVSVAVSVAVFGTLRMYKSQLPALVASVDDGHMWDVLSSSRHLGTAEDSRGYLNHREYDLPTLEGRRFRDKDGRIQILDAIELFDGCKCANFRDRIDALRKITTWPYGANHPEVDYTMTRMQMIHYIVSACDQTPQMCTEPVSTCHRLGVQFGISSSVELKELIEERRGDDVQIGHPNSGAELRIRVGTEYYSGAIVQDCHNKLALDVGKYGGTIDNSSLMNFETEMLESIRSSKAGQALMLGHQVIGRLPARAQVEDIVLYGSGEWCVLRRMEQHAPFFEIIGLAVLVPGFWRTIRRSKNTRKSRMMRRSKLPAFYGFGDTFMDLEDFFVVRRATTPCKSSESWTRIERVLATMPTRSRFSSYAKLRGEPDVSSVDDIDEMLDLSDLQHNTPSGNVWSAMSLMESNERTVSHQLDSGKTGDIPWGE